MYDQIAHLYDQIHSGFTEDVDFLIEQKNDLVEPILELGCGSGRILLALAQAGLRIIGIDNSLAMLVRARQKLEKQPQAVRKLVTILEGDISSFTLPEKFGTAICSHNTLYHLPESERIACFRSIHQHLKPGGIIFIDQDNPFKVADPVDDGLILLERRIKDTEGGNILLHFASSRVDPTAEKCYLTWIYDESPIAGGPVSRIVVDTTFHIVSRHQLELELERTGFALKAVYGDYQKQPYTEDSQRLLVLAEKNVSH